MRTVEMKVISTTPYLQQSGTVYTIVSQTYMIYLLYFAPVMIDSAQDVCRAFLSDPDATLSLAFASLTEHPVVAIRILSFTCPSQLTNILSRTSSSVTSRAELDGTIARTTRRALSLSFSFDILRSTICPTVSLGANEYSIS